MFPNFILIIAIIILCIIYLLIVYELTESTHSGSDSETMKYSLFILLMTFSFSMVSATAISNNSFVKELVGICVEHNISLPDTYKSIINEYKIEKFEQKLNQK